MYKDEDEDVISPEGANRFFDDLNVSLEGVCVKTFLAASATMKWIADFASACLP